MAALELDHPTMSALVVVVLALALVLVGAGAGMYGDGFSVEGAGTAVVLAWCMVRTQHKCMSGRTRSRNTCGACASVCT